MAEKQTLEPVRPRMTRHLPNFPCMSDPDAMELVWENGQISIRGSSSKIPEKNFSFSGYFSPLNARIQREGETFTAANGVADSTKMDRRKNKITCLETCYQELRLSELYEDGYDVASEADKACYDKQLVDLDIVAANKFNVPQLEEEIIPQQTMNNDMQVPQSCSEQSGTHVGFMRSDEKTSRIDEKSERMNFSLFSRSPALHKCNQIPSSGATIPTGSDDDLQGKPGSGPTRSNPFEKQDKFMEPQKELVPDEQSEAVGFNENASNTRFPSSSRVQGPSSSSVCSRGASNCPIYTLKTRYEDTDLDDNNAMEEAQETTKAAPSNGSKRKRKPEVHSLSEKRRRDKINKKMRALQELIPNCNKVDKASVLDEAIEYLKTLQLQVQMMSMGSSGVYMTPMMLPAASMQHIHARVPWGGYSPMAVPMQMAMGLGCTSVPQLPSISSLNMLGLPGQVLLRSMLPSPRSPFVSLARSPDTLSQIIRTEDKTSQINSYKMETVCKVSLLASGASACMGLLIQCLKMEHLQSWNKISDSEGNIESSFQ
ncbi:hypothetical protein V6N13_146726 [Hibiscus sabdariffa]